MPDISPELSFPSAPVGLSCSAVVAETGELGDISSEVDLYP